MTASSDDLEIDLLRAFLFVQQTGGFSQAAALLNRTQPAISLQIKRLESRVGSRLFERSRNGVVNLTATGITLASYAHQILAMHDEAVSRLAAPSVRTRIRIGILEELGHSRLPIVLRSFSKVFPNTSPQVQVSLSNQLVSDLMLGRTRYGGRCRRAGLHARRCAVVGTAGLGGIERGSCAAEAASASSAAARSLLLSPRRSRGAGRRWIALDSGLPQQHDGRSARNGDRRTRHNDHGTIRSNRRPTGHQQRVGTSADSAGIHHDLLPQP